MKQFFACYKVNKKIRILHPDFEKRLELTQAGMAALHIIGS